MAKDVGLFYLQHSVLHFQSIFSDNFERHLKFISAINFLNFGNFPYSNKQLLIRAMKAEILSRIHTAKLCRERYW